MQTTAHRLQILIASMVIMLLGSSQAMIAEGREMGGPRGGEVMRGPMGDTAVEGPRGNVAVGTRYNEVPNLANTVVVDGQTYYGPVHKLHEHIASHLRAIFDRGSTAKSST
jgi:hypothetical protein